MGASGMITIPYVFLLMLLLSILIGLSLILMGDTYIRKEYKQIILMIIVLVIVAIWLAIFGLLIKLDVGGFGSGVLYPVLKDVPVLNKILPEPDQKETDSTYYDNLADANARIKELEAQLPCFCAAGCSSISQSRTVKLCGRSH